MPVCAQLPTMSQQPPGAGVRPISENFAAGDLTIALPPVDPATSCKRVYDIFAERPDWPALAVVSRNAVVGMIDRPRLFATFAKPLLRDLYERRPISLLMDRHPLCVDIGVSLDEISR